jgi:uncharacterized RDD family membrane protein YckC
MMDNQTNIDTNKLQLAHTRKRALAFMIDDFAITFVVTLMLWDKIATLDGDYNAILLLINGAFIQVVVLKFLYQTFFIWYYGATLGKMTAKIKVIDFDNFGKVGFVNSVLRSIGRLLSESLLYIGFFLAFYTRSKQTFHDKMGRTLVVDA